MLVISTQPLTVTHPTPTKACKSNKKGTQNAPIGTMFFKKTASSAPPSPVALLYSCKTQNLLCQREINYLILLFAFLLMNSLGKQAVSLCSIKQPVEIALSFVGVCFQDQQSVLLKISLYSFFFKWMSTLLF